jgi:hypothetical protein
VVEKGVRQVSAGVAQGADLSWAVLAILCAAVSGRMLVAAEREGLTSQAWLTAACFGLWSALAVLYFWGAV